MNQIEQKELLLKLIEGASPQEVNQAIVSLRYYTLAEASEVIGCARKTLYRDSVSAFIEEVDGVRRIRKTNIEKVRTIVNDNKARNTKKSK